jgi:hypothetical protein
MHFKLRTAVGLLSLPLLSSALAVGATAPPASAQTWRDTALEAFHVTQPASSTTTGAVVNGVVGGGGSRLSFTAPPGENFAASPTLTGKTGTFDAKLTTANVYRLVLTAGGFGSGHATLTFTIKSANSAVTCTAKETVQVSETGGVLGESATPTSVPSETVAVGVFNNNATGAVQFTGNVTPPGSCAVTFSQTNLPGGLVSGNPLVPGNAYPRSYTGVIYTATDPLGSTFSGTFGLRVFGQLVVPPPPPPPPPPQGNYGDMVNPFGNGFDAYQQHQYPGAIVAGWTATQADPATHFIRLAGTVPGAYRFEYAPNGAGSGLCVSDPGGGWASDPLPDGLILTVCNLGPWQQFIPQRFGTLRDAATGLFVSPDGTGAQLRGTAYPTPWGGSRYTWTDYANLPG